jgi:4-hydroxybenzoate polyprenyltransferase
MLREPHGHLNGDNRDFRKADAACFRFFFSPASVATGVVDHDRDVLSDASGTRRLSAFLETLARALYVVFPLGLLLYGVNDIVDAEADLLNPRKGTFLFGSRGAAEQLKLLRWLIAATQIPFLALFTFLLGPRILSWFALMLLAVAIYNAPRIGWKRTRQVAQLGMS